MIIHSLIQHRLKPLPLLLVSFPSLFFLPSCAYKLVKPVQLALQQTQMPPITCHILDTTLGRPAANVLCELSYLSDNSNSVIATALTDNDGRIKDWNLKNESDSWILSNLRSGIYKVRFNTSDYFSLNNRQTFFPFVDIVFQLPENPDNHYHIPLLLSNYGYSTYRGS